jgi:hypothetical protein
MGGFKKLGNVNSGSFEHVLNIPIPNDVGHYLIAYQLLHDCPMPPLHTQNNEEKRKIFQYHPSSFA